MIKRITMKKYDEEILKTVLETLKKWPGAGPAEIAITVDGMEFVITGDPKAESADGFIKSLVAQASALNSAFGK